MKETDILVVGGGAAGLMAAICAAKRRTELGKNSSVVLLEGSARVTKKLLATGGGRCNLTNSDIKEEFYNVPENLRIFLQTYSASTVLKQFEKLGLLSRMEDEGRIYPYSGQASSVSDVLRESAKRYGVEIYCEKVVSSVSRLKNSGYILSTQDGEKWSAKAVILACGGKSAPQLGCKRDGYQLARMLGHTVSPLKPALCPIPVVETDIKAFKGIRCRAKVSLFRGNTCLKQEIGEVQFTENALSGICVFQLAKFSEKGDQLVLNFMPDYTIVQIERFLQEKITAFPEMFSDELLGGVLPKRIGQKIARNVFLENLRCAELTKQSAASLAKGIQNFVFTVSGQASWQQAQVTSGGILLSEIDLYTMASLKNKGLYFAGEMLDVDGMCGGYNLHWAWSSGMLAGTCAAEEI